MKTRDRSSTDATHHGTEVSSSGSRAKMHVVGSRGRFRQGSFIVVGSLVLSDALLALAAWEVTFLLRVTWGLGLPSGATMAIVVPNTIAWVGLRAALGLYPGYGLGHVEELRRQTFALLATLAITTVFAFASTIADSLSRLSLFAWALSLSVVGPVARNGVKRAMKRMGLLAKPVVVIGSQEAGRRVLKALQREWHLAWEPVGVYDNLVAPASGELEGVPYRGTMTDAVALAHKSEVDTAIFAVPRMGTEHQEFVALASHHFRHVVIVPDFGGSAQLGSAVVAKDLAGMFGVEIKYSLLDPWAQRLKRAMDIGVTAVGGALVLPIILTLALLVWVQSRRPIFYSDLRLGRDGKLFPCYKFRTMVPDAETMLQQMLEEDDEIREEYLTYHKLRNDPRITRVGRFLRKTSLDELPQLWNVLRGEMSLVGPRPYLSRESDQIGAAYNEIKRVPPGITGPWQVSGRNSCSFEDRVLMDAYYVRDWSVWLDLLLLARTVRVLLSRRDAY